MMNNNNPIVLKKGAIEKRIWGHRLYDEQGGMMTLLEFLCVLESRPFAHQVSDPSMPLTEENAKLGSYEAPKRTLLRSLVFNNPYIDEIYTNVADPWEAWKAQFVTDTQNQNIDIGGQLDKLASQIGDLKQIFNENGRLSDRDSFERFAKVIRLLRHSGINLSSSKRWTSLFLFPWGKHCLFLDMGLKGETSQRRFFARNGEMMYMLLCFAERRDELASLLNSKLLESGNDLDQICEMLSFGKDSRHTIANDRGEGCTLPLDFFQYSRRRINILCEDLIRIFQLPIPTPDIIRHAVKLISLNFLCYFLEQSRAAIVELSSAGIDLPNPIIPCEVLQKQTSGIRHLSKRFFEINQDLSLNAVRVYYEAYSANGVDEEESDEDDLEGFETLDGKDGASNDRLSEILETHKGHWGPSLHRFLAKDCGLATMMCTNSYRYAPSDALIETLAAVIVPVERKRLLLTEFLEEAFNRYGLIFGEQEFSRIKIKDKDIVPNNSEFEANKERLQRKLRSLGLLVALSDGFEFVLNPYKV